MLGILKIIFEKLFDNFLSAKKQKQVIAYENSIQRSIMAYKLLVEKELNFYEKYFDYASDLVTHIQDVEYNYLNFDAAKLKEYILAILEIIPKLKKETIINESYYDPKIGDAILNLIKLLQDDFVHNVENMILKELKNEEIKKICEDILMNLALIGSLIYSSEKSMSI